MKLYEADFGERGYAWYAYRKLKRAYALHPNSESPGVRIKSSSVILPETLLPSLKRVCEKPHATYRLKQVK